MQATAGPESAFDAPLFPTHSSHLYCHQRAGRGRQNCVCPRARETRHCFFAGKWFLSIDSVYKTHVQKCMYRNECLRSNEPGATMMNGIFSSHSNRIFFKKHTSNTLSSSPTLDKTVTAIFKITAYTTRHVRKGVLSNRQPEITSVVACSTAFSTFVCRTHVT